MTTPAPAPRWIGWHRAGPGEPWRPLTPPCHSEDEAFKATCKLALGGDWIVTEGRDPNRPVAGEAATPLHSDPALAAGEGEPALPPPRRRGSRRDGAG